MLDISLVVGGEDGSEQGPRIYLGSQAATQVFIYSYTCRPLHHPIYHTHTPDK